MSELKNEIILENEEVDKGFTNTREESFPEFVMEPYKVYARPNSNNQVERFFSTCFEEAMEGDVILKEGFGDEYVHINYLTTIDHKGCHNYKIEDGKIIETTEEEKLAEFESIKPIEQPSEIDLIKQENELLKTQIKELNDKVNFFEDVMAEMATTIYNK